MQTTFLVKQAGLLVLSVAFISGKVSQAQTSIDPYSGVAELSDLSSESIREHISSNTRPLFTANEQESFLQELDGIAPNWVLLHNQPGEEHGERLFVFNRARDKAREGHGLLKQRIAFLWSGILRKYIPKLKGFSIAMGPDLTQTKWGIVRFKPSVIPHEMIAIPSPAFRASFKDRLDRGEQIEIKILFAGRLIPEESVMYAFSHDGLEQGMIMPVVKTEVVHYFFSSLKCQSTIKKNVGIEGGCTPKN